MNKEKRPLKQMILEPVDKDEKFLEDMAIQSFMDDNRMQGSNILIGSTTGGRNYSEEDVRNILKKRALKHKRLETEACGKCGRPVNRGEDVFCANCGNTLT